MVRQGFEMCGRRLRRATGAVVACLYLMGGTVTLAGEPVTAVGSHAVQYQIVLPDGAQATLYKDGRAEIISKDHRRVEYRRYLAMRTFNVSAPSTTRLPDEAHFREDLMKAPKMAPDAVKNIIVVFRTGVGPLSDSITIPGASLVKLRERHGAKQLESLAPSYTNDQRTNVVLASLGVDHSERLFRHYNKDLLSEMRSTAQAKLGRPLLNFENAYRLHITSSSARVAMEKLRRLSSVAYVSLDWPVTTMQAPSIELPQNALHPQAPRAARMARPIASVGTTQSVPQNYTLVSSAQSMLNAPGLDAVPAFDEIQRRFGQLPGEGEIITNVSIGDLDDASVANSPNDPCFRWTHFFGPTTVVVGGQRYIDWPSMPLIPAYVADTSGNLSGSAEVCGNDPFLGEVGLDFSMMAPLPHALQRAGETGSWLTDFIGIAPGASYRLIVPGTSGPTISDIDAALLGAASQSPRPNIITASVGFGFDTYGFPGRYLEDDPLSQAIIASVVNNYGIVVCISANDGTRLFTNTAIGPSGGSAPTQAVHKNRPITALDDIALSTVPSAVYDSGAIDVGGTTLDDIFAAPPQDPNNSALEAQHAFAETRWTGFTTFSSGFGSRVNVSAPSDNVLAFGHRYRGAADSVTVSLAGGTSASAPEVAAAAAIALQVARLTGHPFASPLDVRAFLEKTATPVAAVPQADVSLNVGPQVNLRNIVETLLRQAGTVAKPSVARVAVEQRRDLGGLDAAYVSWTDPSNIDLSGSALTPADGSDMDENAWITIAPDWEGMPAGTTYRLSIGTSATSSATRVANGQSLRRVGNSVLHLQANRSSVLATTPWARLLPARILQAAGLPLASSTSRTVQLTYEARTGSAVRASITFALTFGPADQTSMAMLAPVVPPVVTSTTIPVSYDLTSARNTLNPTLIVSTAGRFDPATCCLFNPAYTMPLTALKGTVNVPVSALHGGGIYGIGIQTGTGYNLLYSDFAFTRVASSVNGRPPAPLLAVNNATPGHFLEIPLRGSFQVSWDVTNVPGATGAALEISSGGPTSYLNYNTFSNPNGTERDNNGVDTGSVYFARVGGTTGTDTINAMQAGLTAALSSNVRVIPERGGVPIGEASDVSTIKMDGIVPDDGGSINIGFGVDALGNDGFLTSNSAVYGYHGPIQSIGSQLPQGTLSSLQTFDQDAGTTHSIDSAPNSNIFFAAGAFGDAGLYGRFDTKTWGVNGFQSITPIASGASIPWTPPANQFLNVSNTASFDVVTASNAYNSNASFLAWDTQRQVPTVFTTNLANGTSGTAFDMSGPINQLPPGAVGYVSFAENVKTQDGVLVAVGYPGQPPTIVQANLNTGTTTSFQGIGRVSNPFLEPIAVDSVTNRAAVVDGQGLGIYDLSNGTGKLVAIPGLSPSNAIAVAADDVHSLFFVEVPWPPDQFTNNNALAAIIVYDESGNIVAQYENAFLWNIGIPLSPPALQLNWKTRTAYTIGPFGTQIEAFKY